MIKKIITGFEYCYQHRIVHTDIKTENILLKENYEPLIIDFETSVKLPPNEDFIILNKIYGTPNLFEPL